MSSYEHSGPRSSYEPYPQGNAHHQHNPQFNQSYDSQPQQQHYQPPLVNPDAVILHPTHHQHHSHHVDPYLQPQSQHPPYSRHASHQSHHSHHSHHPQRHDSDDSERYDSDRDYERRPTFGDTLSLVWHTLVGAVTGKRR